MFKKSSQFNTNLQTTEKDGLNSFYKTSITLKSKSDKNIKSYTFILFVNTVAKFLSKIKANWMQQYL